MKKTIILTSLSLLTVIISSSVVDARALIKDQQVAVQKLNLKAGAGMVVNHIPVPVIGVEVRDNNADNMVFNGFEVEAESDSDVDIQKIQFIVAEPQPEFDVNNVHIFLDNQDDNFVINGDDVDGATATTTAIINNGDLVEIDPDGFQLEDIEFE